MPISKESLKGYILEEVIAFLIRNTGYRVIFDANEDPDNLKRIGPGLAVIGRGAVHQADILGQLQWIPAFTFPLRLFVEAKFRESRTGISTVRNAVGVIIDVNQKNTLGTKKNAPVQKFHYAYSLFSTSGFSDEAQEMALAHQISLVDLGGPEYSQLRDAIDKVAEGISTTAKRGNLVYNLRHVLRSALETEPPETGLDDRLYVATMATELRIALNIAIEAARAYNELFVGMAYGPFILLLKANDPEHFLNYARENPKHKVTISWDRSYEEGRVWVIRPSREQEAYSLEFRLPRILDEWIFEASRETRQRALRTKRDYFSTITIYRRDVNADQLFTLEFDLPETERQASLTRGDIQPPNMERNH